MTAETPSSSVDDVSEDLDMPSQVGPGSDDATGTEDTPAGNRRAWTSVARSAGVRVMVLPLSAVLGVLITRLIVEHFGKDAYAQYGLLVAIGALLPFADLGMSAAIMNTVGGSEDPSSDPQVRRVLITSIRVLLCSGGVIVLVSLLISVLGLWDWLLGDGLMQGAGPVAAGLCLALIGISLPVGFGQRVLTGLGKNHVMIGLLALQSPIVFLVLLAIVNLGDGSGGYLPVIPYAATFVLTIAAVVVASRYVHPQIGAAIRDVPRVRTVRGGKVADVAWPMLIQAIALPIAMQTDRLVLSHVSDAANLATYNLSAQMYLPVWQVITASGAALWPIFARARARGSTRDNSPLPIAAGFAAAAAAVCLLIAVVSPWLADVASDGQITVPPSMLIAFSLFMVCQAIQYPLGTFLTDAAGLRYQAALIVMMVPCNLGLSIVLGSRYGAVGPVIASAATALVFQAGGNLVYVRRRLAEAARADAHEPRLT